MKKYERAEKEFKTALKRGGEEFQVYYGLGLCAYRQGQYEKAEENFRKAMEHATTRTKEEEKDIIRTLLTRIGEEGAR
jgi:Tfp pilus assembly protein PilF